MVALIVQADSIDDVERGLIRRPEVELDALRNGQIPASRGVLNRDKHLIDRFLSTQCNVLYVKYTE